MNPPPPGPLGAPLAAALRLLAEERLPHVLIGGLAVSQLARPRLTADIDLLAILDDDDRLPAILERARGLGLEPRLAAAATFARERRVLLLRHVESGVGVDISLGLLPFEREAVSRAVATAAGELVLPLPTVEDLIILKAVAHRPRDLADIAELAAAHPALYRRRIIKVVRQFAAALESSEILGDLEALLPAPARRRNARPARVKRGKNSGA